MLASKPLVLASLSVLSLASIYFIIILQFQNGTMSILDNLASNTPHLLPPGPAGNSVPLRHVYTGIWILDVQVNRMTPFFWPLVSGAMPELSLFGIYMAGQLVASETLLILEGERRGNVSKIISYSTIWGLTWQNLPWGFVQPIYNLVHLLTAPSSAPTATTITGHTQAVFRIPLSIVAGYIIPSILMCIPSPQVVSNETHQALVFAWQLFPLWVGIAHIFLTRILPPNKANNPIRAIRSTYTFGLLIACVTHLSIAGLVLALIYAPASAQSHLQMFLPPSFSPSHPTLVFTPFPPHFGPFGKPQVRELSIGVLSLLQYDTIFAGFSSLMWASHLLFSNRRHTDENIKLSKSLMDIGEAVFVAFFLTSMFGPCGAALATVWKRDEEVFAASLQNPGMTVSESKKHI